MSGELKPVALSVWYGSMPESNGKSNWTAILHRKGECMSEGITIDHGEHPDRVRYEADCMRFLIGELPDEPDILDYDAEAHSGYADPQHNPTQYRYALTPRSDLLDLCPEKPEPIAYFRDELAARTCGLKMYGCYHEVSDIFADSIQGKSNVED